MIVPAVGEYLEAEFDIGDAGPGLGERIGARIQGLRDVNAQLLSAAKGDGAGRRAAVTEPVPDHAGSHDLFDELPGGTRPKNDGHWSA